MYWQTSTCSCWFKEIKWCSKKNDVVKKTAYDKLVEKVNNIDTRRFVLKTKYGTDKSELESKVSDTSGLV